MTSLPVYQQLMNRLDPLVNTRLGPLTRSHIDFHLRHKLMIRIMSRVGCSINSKLHYDLCLSHHSSKIHSIGQLPRKLRP